MGGRGVRPQAEPDGDAMVWKGGEFEAEPTVRVGSHLRLFLQNRSLKHYFKIMMSLT